MTAATIHSLSSAPRTRRAVSGVPDDADPASLTVTVHIDLSGGPLPPVAVDLLEQLRALADRSQSADPGPADQPDGATPLARVTAIGPAALNPSAAAGPEWAGRPARSRNGSAGSSNATPAGAAPSSSALRVFLASRIVLRDGVPVRLTRREFDLLAFLCANPRRVFGRAQLLRHVWGYEMVSGERTVDVHVRRLRAKLGESGPLIATVRGVGYRLDEATRVTMVAEPD
jgi:two-component system, OmpR family, response regulator